MKKLYSLIWLFIVLPFFSNAQTVSQQEIKKSGDYYYGVGTGYSENEAMEHAVSRVSQMISLNVSSNFTKKVKQTEKEFDSQVNQVIETHSMATLNNVKYKVKMLEDSQYEVFCYIRKSEVNKIFDERKKMVAGMFKKAINNEENGNLKFALKYNYFGLLLLQSIPSENVVYNGLNLTHELPSAINRILNGIDFKVISDRKISDQERRLIVDVSYKQKPVSLLDLSFWAGSENQASSTVRDGKAIIDLFGSSISFDVLKISVEYRNYNARKEFKPVETLWPILKKPTFDNMRRLTLKIPDKAQASAKSTNLELHYDKSAYVPESKILENTQLFLNVLNQQNIHDYFEGDIFLQTKIKNYLAFNHPEPTILAYELKINPTISGFEGRRIPVIHHYPTLSQNHSKQTTEYCVLDFDKEGNLMDFNLSITESLYDTFRAQSDFANDWKQRQEIIKFVEKYRTAYLTRDIETIDKMFADDALIIVGREIKRKPKIQDHVKYNQLPGQPTFEKIRLTKKEYISRQKSVFKYQKDISVDFSTFKINRKSNAENVYGVEMRQNYASTTYADEGYLFLMIDFNEANPTIYIRAWQPNEWDSASLVNTANFRVYK
jgi:hypothetical protein